MKIKENILYYVLSLILLTAIFVLISLFSYYKFKGKYSDCLKNYDIVNNIAILNTYSYKNIGLYLNGGSVLKDNYNNKTVLQNIILKDYTLIFRISDKHCLSCVKSGLQSLAENSSKIPKDNIIILGAFDDSNLLKSYMDKLNIDFRYYRIFSSIKIDAEEYDIPYFLIIDKNLKIISCFFPEKSKTIFNDYFLSSIKHLFFNSKE